MPDPRTPDTETNVFDEIRAGCCAVSERARHVRIVHERIPDVVAPLLGSPLPVPYVDTDSHVVSDPQTAVAFFLTLAAINFGSGDFPALRKRPGCSGYYTVATALKERFEQHGPWSAEALHRLTASECADTFGQDLSTPRIADLMHRFSMAWNDLGADLMDSYDGEFTRCIEAANHRASHLVLALARQPFFRDVSRYGDLDVPFYKRSQLLASDLAQALGHRGWGRFDDLHKLTLFADNLVPHVLRLDGVLEYRAELLRRIEAEELLPAGSEEEIEIRAVSVHAVERMVAEAASHGVQWTARDLDQLLWHKGQDPRYKTAGKRHRTRTVFY
jgi:hypothetical protein